MRISGLPTFLPCPSSALPVEYPYDPISDAADMGNAVHVALAQHVMKVAPDLDAIATRFSVSVDELEKLFSYGVRAWREIERHFPHPRVEQSVKARGLSGHIDIEHADENSIVVSDWKSNRIKRNYRAQVVGYAAATVAKYGMPESGEVYAITVWLRFGEFDIQQVSSAEIEALFDDIERARADVGKRYGPGEPCTFCRRQLVCEARQEYLQSSAGALMPLGSVEVTPEFLPQLYSRAKMLRKALAAYDQALKMHLRTSGPADDGSGLMLELEETSRDKIVGDVAWPHLVEAGFSEADLAYCMSMSKTKIMEVHGQKQPRGHKGKAKVELLKTLRAKGGVTTSVSESILARQVKS